MPSIETPTLSNLRSFMKLFRSLVLFCFFVITSSVSPVIIDPVASMEEVKKHVEAHLVDGCWVIFDLDNTVFHPADEKGIGSDQWFLARVNEHVKLGKTYVEGVEIVLPEYFTIQLSCKMKPVEDKVVGFIKSLQDRNVTVCALTARSGVLVDHTPTQLGSIGVSFDKTCPKLAKPLKTDQLTFPARYHAGGFFTGNNKKGEGLKILVDAAEKKPTKIIFIEDRDRHVKCVHTLEQELKISVVALRYAFLDEEIANYKLPADTRNNG